MTKKTAMLFELQKPFKEEILNKETGEIIEKLAIKHLEPKNGETYELKELQEAVGGYIAIVGAIRITNEVVKEKLYTIIVDEEGIPKDLPINYGFWWSYGDSSGKYRYRGNVLLVPEELIK